MSCILLVDGNEVAKRAMHGILSRGGHRLATVPTAAEAWTFVAQHIRVDLIFVELKLEGGSGMGLVQKLKNDPFLKYLPVVIYTQTGDRDMVKQALNLRVQNILIKPYHDDLIYTEIAKAEVNPWRNRHFEEEKSFCKQMGFPPEELHRMLAELGTQLKAMRPLLENFGRARSLGAVKDRVKTLNEQAEAAGAWGVVDFLGELLTCAEREEWTPYQDRVANGEIAEQLIARHLDPDFLPEPFLSSQEINAAHEEQERLIWANAPREGRCPVVTWERIQRELDALAGCPVVDSTAAAFEMTASGQPSSLNPLMDLVARDTGLSAQMLICASQLKRAEDFDPTPLEDPRLAVGRMGEVKLASMAHSLVTVEERYMNLPPHFSWPDFWIFQMAVARVARFTCHYLELYSLELQARMGGLLHDLGKLLLLKLYPFGFQTILAYARENRVPLAEAEKYFLGCTSHEMAAYFAEKNNLSAAYVDILRWVDRPEEAPSHRELVAVISLARDLCRQTHIGNSGDPVLEQPVPLEETSEWNVLKETVFPSFDLRKFEQQVHADCRELKLELQGRLKKPAVG